ncbi:AAA-like domain-containing protein [Anabaena sp. PCC 7108]|uniref:AAA-like domain-containing protein n=1 Tax=Anabaena sp. PCC 7108 TaxID=163908 RepID=UPI0003461754
MLTNNYDDGISQSDKIDYSPLRGLGVGFFSTKKRYIILYHLQVLHPSPTKTMTSPVQQYYQFGGSLPPHAPTYVTRKTDEDLYQAVKAGEFCFVLNSLQMGKSSLRVRTMQRLQTEKIACVAIDLTAIGTSGLNSEQWYNGIINNISESLKLEDKFDLDALWEENKPLYKFGKIHNNDYH